MYYSKMASAIYNDIYSGLAGLKETPSLSVEQIEDEIPLVRMRLLTDLSLKGLLNSEEFMYSINCIPVDCQSIDRCPECIKGNYDCKEETLPHFTIPQLVVGLNIQNIKYLGSTDRSTKFKVFTDLSELKIKNYTKRRKKLEPYVYIDTTPNTEGMLDGYIFNAPLIEMLSITALFKDLRDLEGYNCCNTIEYSPNSLDSLVQQTITESKIKYYRNLKFIGKPTNLDPV